MNEQLSRFPFFAAFLALLALPLLSMRASAQEPSATASLSEQSTTVGRSVELSVTVNGVARISDEPTVSVDGLAIRYMGQSSQMRMENFSVSSVSTLTYNIQPMRSGTFAIPAIQIPANGRILETQALTLTVTSQRGSTGSQNASPDSTQSRRADSGQERIAFAEWVVPKTVAYVGESLPVELHLYLKEQIRWQLQEMPVVNGDGFTIQKFPNPKDETVTREGGIYDLVVFKTAVTPVKPGEIVLPGVAINTIAVIPRKRSNNSRMPGFPDPFSDPFFDDAFALQQQVKVQPDPVTLTAKALPLADRPRNFSGAVGQFTLQTSASPTKGRVGDPITVRSIVSGVGSFDRMEAPQVADLTGWQSYPPSKNFQADDAVGVSGNKTFEMALIPKTPATELPAIEFSFFDPSKERYITLRGDPIPLEITADPSVSTPKPALNSAVSAPGASPSAAKADAGSKSVPLGDILHIRTDSRGWGASFAQAWQMRTFWLAQLIPFTALLGFFVWLWKTSRGENRAASKLAALRREKEAFARKLDDKDLQAEDFYRSAVGVIQIETVMRKLREQPDLEPKAIDAEAACAGRSFDAITEQSVRRLFARYDEFRYAGAGSGALADVISLEERRAILELLGTFEKGGKTSSVNL